MPRSSKSAKSTRAGFGLYELDVERVLAAELPVFISEINPVALSNSSVERLESTFVTPDGEQKEWGGVYVLLEKVDRELVIRYVGKTDAEAGFKDRLTRHVDRLRHRKNLDPSKIYFKACAIAVFKNADVENILIGKFKATWNKSGFGSNDPGRNRDGQEPSKFDKDHPINIDLLLDEAASGKKKISTFLEEIKNAVPYEFRFERQKPYSGDYDAFIDVPKGDLTMRNAMELLIDRLPNKKWQISVLHGRVVMYPQREEFKPANYQDIFHNF